MRTTLFIAFLLSSVCSASSEVPVVFTKKAALNDLFDVLSYPARVESKVNATIYAEGEGVVSRVFAPLGTPVNRGAKLLVIRHTDPVYQYAPMVFTSTFKGTVSQVHVTEGTHVIKGQALISMTDPQQVRIVVEIAAQDLAHFQKPISGEFVIPAREKPLVVKVKGVSPFVDPGTGTATCELEVGNSDPNLLLQAGLVGQVSFKVNQRRSFVFPEHALVYKDAGTFLRIVREGKAKKQAVNLGQRQRGQIEILSGLRAGDEVIERASGFVADGETVTVQSAATTGKTEGASKSE